MAQRVRAFAGRFAAQYAQHLTDAQVQQAVLVDLLQHQPAERPATPPPVGAGPGGGPRASATPPPGEGAAYNLSFRHECS